MVSPNKKTRNWSNNWILISEMSFLVDFRAVFILSYHIATMGKPGQGIRRRDALHGLGDRCL
jgi:hypothetical protein